MGLVKSNKGVNATEFFYKANSSTYTLDPTQAGDGLRTTDQTVFDIPTVAETDIIEISVGGYVYVRDINFVVYGPSQIKFSDPVKPGREIRGLILKK